MQQDLTDLQYILYTCRMGYAYGIVDYSIRLWPFNEPRGFALSTLPVLGFDTDSCMGDHRSVTVTLGFELE
jgi:hypothetical protein